MVNKGIARCNLPDGLQFLEEISAGMSCTHTYFDADLSNVEVCLNQGLVVQYR